MGYTHYWRRVQEFDPESYKAVVRDFQRIRRHLRMAGVMFAGPHGDGEPVFNDEQIRFNGPSNCGHDHRDLGITWPAENPDPEAVTDEAGTWFAGLTLNRRTCGGDCSHESFILDRIDREDFNFCKTAYKPYDLAVCCVLIIAKHHLGKAISVSSDGGPEQWRDAVELCQRILYPEIVCPISAE